MTISVMTFFLYLNFLFLLMWLTLSTFPTRSLVESGPIHTVYMCFHPMISSRNFTNKAHFQNIIKKLSSICSVLQYAIYVLLISTHSFTKKYCISMCLELPIHNLFSLFSIFITLLLCWNSIFFLKLYTWDPINICIQILYNRHRWALSVLHYPLQYDNLPLTSNWGTFYGNFARFYFQKLP